MSDHYNLDDQVQDDFSFILNGKEYRMRYPTTEEALKVQEIKDESKDQLDWLYSFVTPVGDAPPIKDVLNKVNVKKLKKFTEMVTTEFGDTEK